MSQVRAVLVTPLSGPLARFGREGAAALSLWARTSQPGGRRVTLQVVDAHPDAAAAMHAVEQARPDLLFGPYGSGPALAAVRATHRLVWNHGGASSRLRWPEVGNVINILAPASRYHEGAVEAVHDAEGARSSVALLHVDTGFGRDVAGGADRFARGSGWDVHVESFHPGEVEQATRSLPEADLLLVAAGFDDEIAAGRILLRRRWRAAAFVGAGEQDVLSPLGARREGLLGPAQWLASAAPTPDEGPDAQWFVSAFHDRAGHPPSYPAAQAFAAGIVAGYCLAAAGTAHDEAVRQAATQVQLTTFYGRFRLDPHSGLQVGQSVLTVQWQEGRRQVVWPPDRATARLVHPRTAPGRP
ncbi:MAG TPA: ABC transporter substrate-binding protein [Nitriliruptorales bacterium]|nr:ABC transporter substrate-binding protein [Nitriliruptorales bacterium]